MDPDNVTRLRNIEYRVPEFLIYSQIGIPVGLVIPGIGCHVMKNRPEHFVGKAFVIVVDLILAQEYRFQIQLIHLTGDILLLNFIRYVHAGPADPDISRLHVY